MVISLEEYKRRKLVERLMKAINRIKESGANEIQDTNNSGFRVRDISRMSHLIQVRDITKHRDK